MPSNIHHIHRLYIPIFGILIISVEIFKAAYLQLSKFKNFFYILPAAAILLLSVMSYSQSRYYKDRETFWQKAYADNALSPIANAGMSGYYESAGDLDKAERYALAALELSDNKGTLLLNAGKIYYAKQDYEKAALYFIDAVTENKYLENAYLNLSALHLELGNKKNAHDILKKALVLVPQSKKIKKALTFFEAEKK
jgi:Tfp pilus assembly protein PilF